MIWRRIPPAIGGSLTWRAGGRAGVRGQSSAIQPQMLMGSERFAAQPARR